MNCKQFATFSLLFAATAAMADLSVSGVTARQRWPWNNLVDIDFTLGGNAGEAYYIDVTATAAGGEKRLIGRAHV